MRLYLTWDHGEYGPENLLATTDKRDLFAMVGQTGYLVEDYLKEMGDIMNNDTVGIYNITDGWGGLHIQIVDTFDAKPTDT